MLKAYKKTQKRKGTRKEEARKEEPHIHRHCRNFFEH